MSFWSAFQRAVLYLSKQGVFLDVVLIKKKKKKSPSLNLKRCSVFLWAIKRCGGGKKMRNLVETQISPWFYGRMCKQCARLRIQSPAVTGGGPGARMSTSSSPTAPLKFYLQANKIGVRSPEVRFLAATKLREPPSLSKLCELSANQSLSVK